MYSMKFAEYVQVPGDIQNKLIEAFAAEDKDEQFEDEITCRGKDPVGFSNLRYVLSYNRVYSEVVGNADNGAVDTGGEQLTIRHISTVSVEFAAEETTTIIALAASGESAVNNDRKRQIYLE